MFSRRHFRAAMVALAAFLPATAAWAETSTIRIAQQFGISYLPLTVIKERKLLEKHAAAAGLDGLQVEWLQISGAAGMNEALISGNLDFASAGIAPMILTWDKTRGSVGFIGIAALGSMPNVLTSNNPAVRTIRDFTDRDKIALPSVKVGFQPIVLQMAAAKEFGQYDKLDHLTVSLPHPDATLAILSGAAGITAHFTAPPFVQQQLRSGKAHAVLSSYDVLGGPHTFNVVYSVKKFVAANPRTVAAFVAALDEANAWITANPADAAKLYVAAEKSKLEVDFIEAIIRDKDVRFTSVPENTQKFADFEAQVGLIKVRPDSWKDLFQPGLHDRPGS
jgi:ABC-type nitrate/sulfonate/bicarbonate transport systems, periplasmic components